MTLIMPDSFPGDVLDTPYDTGLDAKVALAAVFQTVEQTGKRALINLGANWCPDARLLCATLALPHLAAFIDEAFESVAINVGRYDTNMDIVEQLGFENGLEGVPTVLVTDSKGRRFNAGEETRWRTTRASSPQAIADYFIRFSSQGA